MKIADDMNVVLACRVSPK